MTMQTAGIHHITAFAADPQRNVDFYAGVLGLRLVKKTINYDAPEVYHLYFGDQAGSPGTIITFFPWPEARRGAAGGGQVGLTTFVVPEGALGYWEERLQRLGITPMKAARFGEAYLQFTDHEGLHLELVERAAGPGSEWADGGVPLAYAIKGFGGAVLYSTDAPGTMQTLEQVLGLERVGEDVGFVRFRAQAALGNIIDVPQTSVSRGRGGAGTVHHIAWRAQDADEHREWQRRVAASGFQPTALIDRQYFHALYFRESGGILFEIATDPPGFAVDEAPGELGSRLMLPRWLEGRRSAIEAQLQPIEVKPPVEMEGSQP
ncbi:ring-cleaving dioxygenase [Paenibacillus athensensis]|uniref:Ring-cleaving dioxygenase n=1 Tax=Paenibacillus athensensis TaxID=1967502 RepID=A0A4Y8Q891_9BACL|nr:ring-cleaving dioxygenase [Paenibacillus athensensis]MCD1260361.1 ring-cleaving dioxygenase [Paenibacillus athensensis]